MALLLLDLSQRPTGLIPSRSPTTFWSSIFPKLKCCASTYSQFDQILLIDGLVDDFLNFYFSAGDKRVNENLFECFWGCVFMALREKYFVNFDRRTNSDTDPCIEFFWVHRVTGIFEVIINQNHWWNFLPKSTEIDTLNMTLNKFLMKCDRSSKLWVFCLILS